jgi:hypothetical protein
VSSPASSSRSRISPTFSALRAFSVSGIAIGSRSGRRGDVVARQTMNDRETLRRFRSAVRRAPSTDETSGRTSRAEISHVPSPSRVATATARARPHPRVRRDAMRCVTWSGFSAGTCPGAATTTPWETRMIFARAR